MCPLYLQIVKQPIRTKSKQLGIASSTTSTTPEASVVGKGQKTEKEKES